MADQNKVNFLDKEEKITTDFGHICRFCLSETDSNISILDKCIADNSVETNNDTICNFVMRLSSIKVNDAQNLPRSVCRSCYDLIKICFHFSLVCQQSDMSLRNNYQKTLHKARNKLVAEEWKPFKNLTSAQNSSTYHTLKVGCRLFDLAKEDIVSKLNFDNNKIEVNLTDNKKNNSIKNKKTFFKEKNIRRNGEKHDSTLLEPSKETQSIFDENIVESNVNSNDEFNKVLSTYNNSLDCSKSSSKLTNFETFNIHLIANNKKFEPDRSLVAFQCKKCSENFKNENEFITHKQCFRSNLKLENDEKKFYCLDCVPQKEFCVKDELQKHMEIGHEAHKKSPEVALYKCENCDIKLFSCKLSYKKHLQRLHNVEIENKNDDKNVCVCTDCSQISLPSNTDSYVKSNSENYEKHCQQSPLKELPEKYVNSLNELQKTEFKVCCKNCDPPVEFSSIKLFVSHMQSGHDRSKIENWEIEWKSTSDSVKEAHQEKWECTECQAVYFRRHSLYCHMKEKHNKSINVATIKCPDCKELFFTNRQLIKHGISAHEKYFATHHKIYEKKILKTCNEEENNVTKNFECDVCQKKYVCKNSLKRHILKSHLGKGDIESVVCPYCGKTFSNKLNLKSHIEFVHEALFVSCPICKKKINFQTIGKHYKVHQGNSDLIFSSHQFLCNSCGKILKSKRSFEDHQKLHKNIRDQLCDVCGSGFTTKKFLYLHKKTHEGMKTKVFNCSQCEKVFSGRHTLNRHLLTHSGEKNFVCEMCSKCFYTLQELNRHVRCHKKEYKFDCQLCDMKFLDKSRFRHHMMSHRNIRPHKCQFCDKMFIVRRKMNLHMAAKHNVEIQKTKAVWKDPKTYIPLDDLL